MWAGPAVIGREAELECIRAFVGRVGDGAGALLIEGEAGVGKTTLWQVHPVLNLMHPGAVQSYEARGHFRNGTVAPVTTHVTWSSSNPGVAGVSQQGVVAAQSPGAAGIFARFGNVLTVPGLLFVG
jgi:Bacterial Ig-like domain (group 2)